MERSEDVSHDTRVMVEELKAQHSLMVLSEPTLLRILPALFGDTCVQVLAREMMWHLSEESDYYQAYEPEPNEDYEDVGAVVGRYGLLASLKSEGLFIKHARSLMAFGAGGRTWAIDLITQGNQDSVLRRSFRYDGQDAIDTMRRYDDAALDIVNDVIAAGDWKEMEVVVGTIRDARKEGKRMPDECYLLEKHGINAYFFRCMQQLATAHIRDTALILKNKIHEGNGRKLPLEMTEAICEAYEEGKMEELERMRNKYDKVINSLEGEGLWLAC